MNTFSRIFLCFLALLWMACEPNEAETPSETSTSISDGDEPAEPTDGCGIYAPVCGEDGLTYASACDAQSVGETIATFAPCDCLLSLYSTASSGKVQGVWGATHHWRVSLEISGNNITRIDYLNECAAGTSCPGSGVAVSYGKVTLSGPLVKVTWNQPTINPMVALPMLYVYENTCPDGDAYLVDMTPMQDVFYGRQS